MRARFSHTFTFPLLLVFLLAKVTSVSAQVVLPEPAVDSTDWALEYMKEQRKKWGPNDTIILPAIWYQAEIVNYKEMEMAWVSNLSPEKLQKYIQEWTRLRNAVYV
ncbi:MAG TPA: hypothetical protein PLB49_13075, partial [Chitinophagaceae bacterium]|nr:hypothetical protein [Chitinophagaceae bacterium]